MITDKQIEKLSFEMAQDFEAINVKYIEKMSRHIKRIGVLKSDDLHILEQFAIMNNNIEEINAMLKKQCKITSKQLANVYSRSGADVYDSLSIYYKAKGVSQIPFYKNFRMKSYVDSVSRLTEQAFNNLSRTTAIKRNYQKAVDRGIYAVTNGIENYQTAVRGAVKECVQNGMKVEYSSGYHRRLDSAAKMNVLDGARQVQNGIRQIAGQEFGADGVEISAHALCAPDHLEIQGLQLSNEEFEELNNSLERPIGELNCHHTYYPIVLGISGSAYTDDELEQYKEFSNEKIAIGDSEITRYEAEQSMRKIETKVREQEELKLAANGYGDVDYERRCSDNIKLLNKKYDEISEKANLPKKKNRMKIPKTKDYKKQSMNYYSSLFTK